MPRGYTGETIPVIQNSDILSVDSPTESTVFFVSSLQAILDIQPSLLSNYIV